MNTQQKLALLIESNKQDMLRGLGVDQRRFGRKAISPFCHWPAVQFAHTVLEYDERVGQAGLQAGAQWILRQFDTTVEIQGVENIPTEGGLLLLANHPGMMDAMSLLSQLPRHDVRVLAANRPFLNALPHTARHLIYIDLEHGRNLDAFRETVNHLRNGGTILTFPAGRIEPDPLLVDGAEESLATWSASIDAFRRLAPKTTVIPVAIGGVLSPKARHNPLVRLRKQPKDRDWLAAMLQITIPNYRSVQIRVRCGVHADSAEHKTLTEAVRTQMINLFRTLTD